MRPILGPKDDQGRFRKGVGGRKRDARSEDLEDFLDDPVFRSLLPTGWRPPPRFCTCRPRIPVSAPRRPLADRIVVVGDASYSRYYKNGIFSAFLTSGMAAAVAVHEGVDASSLWKSRSFRR